MIVVKELKPHEILKGKLLGQITDKKNEVIEKYNPLWEEQVEVWREQGGGINRMKKRRLRKRKSRRRNRGGD